MFNFKFSSLGFTSQLSVKNIDLHLILKVSRLRLSQFLSIILFSSQNLLRRTFFPTSYVWSLRKTSFWPLSLSYNWKFRCMISLTQIIINYYIKRFLNALSKIKFMFHSLIQIQGPTSFIFFVLHLKLFTWILNNLNLKCKEF